MRRRNFSIRLLVLLAGFVVLVRTGTAATLPAPAEKQDAAAEIEKLRATYTAVITNTVEEREKWLAALEKWYADGLEKLKGDRAKAADLDGAVAVKAEQDRIAGQQPTSSEDIKTMPAALRTLRASYDAALSRIADEVAKRSLPASQKYLADLEALQKRITVGGDIEQALLVKAEREHFAAEIAASVGKPVPSANTPAPAAPLPAKEPTPSAEGSGTGLAKVEVQEISLAPLAPNEATWSDRNNNFLADIPAKFRGYQFTRSKAHGLTLRFKVLADGLVYMGCTKRWGTTAAPEVAKDFDTAEKLKKAGWKPLPGVEITTSASDTAWVIFSRQCKAGEEFGYRTDKYAPPILLVK